MHFIPPYRLSKLTTCIVYNAPVLVVMREVPIAQHTAENYDGSTDNGEKRPQIDGYESTLAREHAADRQKVERKEGKYARQVGKAGGEGDTNGPRDRLDDLVVRPKDAQRTAINSANYL